MRRVLAICVVALVPLLVLARAEGAADRVKTRIYFSGDLGLERQIYSVDQSGGGLAQLTFSAAPATDPIASPNGRWIAFQRAGAIWAMRANGDAPRRLAKGVAGPVWAPDSSRIAYRGADAILAVAVDGQRRHALVRDRAGAPYPAVAPAWSPDGVELAYARNTTVHVLRSGKESVVVRGSRRQQAITTIAWSPSGSWLAYAQGKNLRLVRPDGRGLRSLGHGYLPTWSPNGTQLAFMREEMLVVHDVATGRERTLARITGPTTAVAWAPDGSQLAYANRGAVQTVSLTGRVRTIARRLWAEGSSWRSPPRGLRYRPPQPLELAAGDELRLRHPVAELAADGDRVAYRFCNRIGAWHPGDRSPVTVRDEPGISPFCNESLTLYGLALAGDRVAWGGVDWGIGIEANWLSVADTRVPATETLVASNGPRTTSGENVRAGQLVGDGSFLTFSTWVLCDGSAQDQCVTPVGAKPTSQTLWRMREPSFSGSCPLLGPDFSSATVQLEGRCERLHTEPGSLVPFDADEGRVLAGGDNATLVLDEDGDVLRSIPEVALGGQLDGRDLVLLRPGELRRYDATSAALVRVLPLPDVPSSGPCGKPCVGPRLRLEDLARGLVLYVLDGHVHLLRLADGRDVVLPEGTAARFGDYGLFYAYETASYPWRGRIRFVPFDRLPL